MVSKGLRLGSVTVLLAASLLGCQKAPVAQIASHSHAEDALDLKAASQLDTSDGIVRDVPAPQGRAGQWILFANHTHSRYWDGKKSLSTMVAEARSKGIQAMALTDHNTMKGPDSAEFAQVKDMVMVRGMEWGAWRENGEEVLGHANLLGMQGSDPLPTHASLDQMLSEATSRGATVIANHPFARGNSWHQPEPDARVQAVEVWNGFWFLVSPIIHNPDALKWWHEALVDGRQLAAVGGSDYHGHWYDRIDRACNLVFVTERTQQGVIEALRQGRVTVLADAGASRLVLEADGNADGQFEAVSGDVLTTAQQRRVALRARVLGGKGKTVIFYSKRGVLTQAKVTSDDAVLPLEVIAKPGEADFIRAELRAHPDRTWSMTALSNPIYLR